MAQTAQLRIVDRSENEAQRVFALQREAYMAHPYPSLAERKENLRKLDKILSENAQAIAEAINADFGHRSVEETLMAEVFASVDGIRHAIKHVGHWMRPQKRSVSVTFAGGSNTVIPQPKGVVGVISPWNYPLFLAVAKEMTLHGFVAFLSALNVTDDDFFHPRRMGRALVVEKGCDSREKKAHEKQRHQNS